MNSIFRRLLTLICVFSLCSINAMEMCESDDDTSKAGYVSDEAYESEPDDYEYVFGDESVESVNAPLKKPRIAFNRDADFLPGTDDSVKDLFQSICYEDLNAFKTSIKNIRSKSGREQIQMLNAWNIHQDTPLSLVCDLNNMDMFSILFEQEYLDFSHIQDYLNDKDHLAMKMRVDERMQKRNADLSMRSLHQKELIQRFKSCLNGDYTASDLLFQLTEAAHNFLVVPPVFESCMRARGGLSEFVSLAKRLFPPDSACSHISYGVTQIKSLSNHTIKHENFITVLNELIRPNMEPQNVRSLICALSQVKGDLDAFSGVANRYIRPNMTGLETADTIVVLSQVNGDLYELSRVADRYIYPNMTGPEIVKIIGALSMVNGDLDAFLRVANRYIYPNMTSLEIDKIIRALSMVNGDLYELSRVANQYIRPNMTHLEIADIIGALSQVKGDLYEFSCVANQYIRPNMTCIEITNIIRALSGVKGDINDFMLHAEQFIKPTMSTNSVVSILTSFARMKGLLDQHVMALHMRIQPTMNDDQVVRLIDNYSRGFKEYQYKGPGSGLPAHYGKIAG